MCEKKIENTDEKVLWTFEEWKKENDYLDLVEQIIQLPLPPLTKYAMIMTSLKIDAMMMRFYLDYYFKKTECHLDEGSKIIDCYQCVDTLIDPKVVEKIENTDVNIPWNFEEWQAENGDLMVDIHLDQHPLERDAMIMGLYLDYYFKKTECHLDEGSKIIDCYQCVDTLIDPKVVEKIENTDVNIPWNFEEWQAENGDLMVDIHLDQHPLERDAMIMGLYLDYYFKKTECHLDEGSKIIDCYQCVDTLIDPKVVEKIENTDVNIPWNFEEWQAENGDLMVDIHLDQHPLERDAMIMGLYLDYYFKTTEHCQCCQCFEPHVENGFTLPQNLKQLSKFSYIANPKKPSSFSDSILYFLDTHPLVFYISMFHGIFGDYKTQYNHLHPWLTH